MGIAVYNTMTRQKEPLVTREPGRVSIYVCGVTPYDYTHVGHARVSVLWDVIRRYLRYRGYRVKMVQNFTDVEDKILKKAAEEGMQPLDLAQKYIDDYFAVMEALGVERADVHPRVSEEIPAIIEMIQGLVTKGLAYPAQGSVFFAVERFPGYGKLSGRSLEEMEAGARVEPDPGKRNPLDFALWKRAKEGEIFWESPWGPGRPGWHIECSAMALRYLGNGFDIHGGGLDLVFPHHENEIAQSEGYTGEAPFARYWLHNGMVNVAEAKMSKSLGNTTAVREVLKVWPPRVLRYFLVSTHYRSPINFSPEEISSAQKSLERLDNTRLRLREAFRAVPEGEVPEGVTRVIEEARQRFVEAMDDDFNTALGLAVVHDLVREINRFLDGQSGPVTKKGIAVYEASLEEFLRIFGLEKIPGGAGDTALVEGLMNLILQLRQTARERKDWTMADAIRQALGELGITVEDTPQGPRWKRSGRDAG